MSLARKLFLGLLYALGEALVGCGDASNGLDSSPAGNADEPMEVDAPCPTDIEEFRVGPGGLARTDPRTGTTVRIENASDVPPLNSYNDWDLVVTDASGAVLQDAQVTWACAWMSVHGHGSNPKRVHKLAPGRFQLYQQNLSMYGPWTITIWVDPDGGAEDYMPMASSGIVDGEVCTPGPRAQSESSTSMLAFDVCVPRSRVTP